MTKTTVYNVPVIDFGTNNYSHGMKALVFNPKDVTVKEVAKLPGIFLHPTVQPNSQEIFAIQGTQEQFDKFKPDAIRSYCTKAVFRMSSGGSMSDTKHVEQMSSDIDDMVEKFVPWYDELMPGEPAIMTLEEFNSNNTLCEFYQGSYAAYKREQY